MAPFSASPTGVLSEADTEILGLDVPSKDFKPLGRSYDVVWKNVFLFCYYHFSALFAVYLMFTSVKWQTMVFSYFMYQAGGMGITAGVHRLWSHRAYKAKWPLRVILMLFNTIAFQDSVIEWARDHRVHHKFSETEADPHNANRGFFYSHVGWLLTRKHPLVKEKGQNIDLSDLQADPVLVFQKKYYFIIMPLICFILPTLAPVYFWGESFVNSYHMNIFRYVFTLNATWLVNSAAHMWGNKPYEKFINPVQNRVVAVLALGEGWHNYHHTFPWDYKTSELGNYGFNFTNAFIDFFAKIGWAYDMKTVAEDMIKKRVLRTGDGSHHIWGWGDKDQSEEERKSAVITHRKSK